MQAEGEIRAGRGAVGAVDAPVSPVYGGRGRAELGVDAAVPPSGEGLVLEEVARLDADVARLGRGVGGWRLRLGEALGAMQRSRGFLGLGFSRFVDYGVERTGRSGRWCQETAAVARRVAGLPLLRRAMLAGEVSWSMGELVSTHATVRDEAALVERARGTTVRSMRAWLAASPEAGGGGSPGGPPGGGADVSGGGDGEEASERWTTLTLTLPDVEAWALEAGIALCSRLGVARREDALEAMLAEGMDALMCAGSVPVAWLEAETRADEARLAARREALEVYRRWREAAEASVEVHRHADGEAVDAGPLPVDVAGLDRVVREVAGRLASRDRELARRAVVLDEASGWRRLGYASATQYARERVGVAVGTWKGAVALGRRLRDLPALDGALSRGEVGVEAARHVARVASPGTDAAWAARAQERTFKHLREELAYAEHVGRLFGRAGLRPPAEEVVRALRGYQRAVTSSDGRMSARAMFDATTGPGVRAWLGEGAPARGRRSGRVEVRLRVPFGLALYYRQVERAWGQSGAWESETGEGFVTFLVQTLARAWEPVLREQEEVAYGEAYARDLWRCSNPVCGRRDVTPHHVVFRSRGGGDEAENIVSLCVDCHLGGVHAGRLEVTGTASHPTWVLGREPVAIVEGRRLSWLA